MGDSILLDGDLVNFLPSFPPAIVVVRPGTLKATGGDPVFGRRMCVEGDERLVVLQNCPYTTMQHQIPGFGTLTIQQLHPASLARKTTSNGKKVLLKGPPFIARFQVTIPAMMTMPNGPQVPDTMPIYTGTGSFANVGASKQGE